MASASYGAAITLASVWRENVGAFGRFTYVAAKINFVAAVARFVATLSPLVCVAFTDGMRLDKKVGRQAELFAASSAKLEGWGRLSH
jgi:hypothetical protein